jgi:calcineurin-like phosphoesterase family protein
MYPVCTELINTEPRDHVHGGVPVQVHGHDHGLVNVNVNVDVDVDVHGV